jgi:hypothetical protein
MKYEELFIVVNTYRPDVDAKRSDLLKLQGKYLIIIHLQYLLPYILKTFIDKY